MRSLSSNTYASKYRRRFTLDTLFRLITEPIRSDETRSFSLNENDQTNTYTNGYTIENDPRHLWDLLSQMIRKRLLKHEPCLLPELGAFVIIDYPPSDNENILIKEPFFCIRYNIRSSTSFITY